MSDGQRHAFEWDKASLRRQANAYRTSPEGLRQAETLDSAMACGLQEVLATHPKLHNISVILAYWPLPGEPDLTPLYSTWCQQGITVYLPRVISMQPPVMRFHRWTPESVMTLHRYGMEEPLESAPVWMPNLTETLPTTLLLAPAVAMDESGTRVGYGGGFYDAFLGALPEQSSQGLLTIGVCPTALVVKHITDTAPHDIGLWATLTENGVQFHDG